MLFNTNITMLEMIGSKNAEAGMPFGRLLKPEEVARAVAFLASEESGMMTGSIVDFDQSVQGAGGQPIPSAEEV